MAFPEPPPMLNSIPSELITRFEPAYIDYFMKYNVGRLQSHQVPIGKYRKDPAKFTTPYARSPTRDVYRVTEQKCPVEGAEITIRIFEPKSWKQGDKLFPVYVNYHGGGWTWGGLESDDPFCRIVTDEVGCVTFDVDYRLAPEYKYPVPIEDSWAALKWVCFTK
jgi:acetyl esterase/lipase